MMVISRKSGEGVRIGDAVVRIGDITPTVVKVIIDAPRSTPIVRAELLRNVRAAQPVQYVIADAVGHMPLKCLGTIS